MRIGRIMTVSKPMPTGGLPNSRMWSGVPGRDRLPPELFEDLSAPELTSDRTNRRQRSTPTVDEVQPMGCIDDHLPAAIEALLSRLPSGWLAEEPADLFRLPTPPTYRPVSIVKGIRPRPNDRWDTGCGRWCRSRANILPGLTLRPLRWCPAGALLVPQLARLGSRLHILYRLPGAEGASPTSGRSRARSTARYTSCWWPRRWPRQAGFRRSYP